MDRQHGVIDFSLYLRSNNKDFGCDHEASALATEVNTAEAGAEGSGGGVGVNQSASSVDIATVLDQKNYIEELNRTLK